MIDFLKGVGALIFLVVVVTAGLHGVAFLGGYVGGHVVDAARSGWEASR